MERKRNNLSKKRKSYENNETSPKEIEDYLEERYSTHDELQRNLSDKFIRTFRRIANHFENIEITALPFIHDTDMHLEIGDYLDCNNSLLKEMYETLNDQSLKK